MTRRHDRRRMGIVGRCFLTPAGYVDRIWENGVWKSVGKYVKYRKNSHAQQHWKRHSNKVVRRRKEIYRGNQYRKCFDYQWTIY